MEQDDMDYIGEDGLLYCGKCRQPRQMRIKLGPEGGEILAPLACRCMRQAEEAAASRAKREQFRHEMERRREDGLCSPEGLRFCFDQDDRRNPKVSDVCRLYAERWEEMLERNIGVLFYGGVGSGKSFLASCIGAALLERQVPAAAASFPRLLNLLQGTYAKQALLDRLSAYKLLVLDDLGAERSSDYAEEQVFNIVDARLSSRLPAAITTNLTLTQLENPDSIQRARIYDRVLEMCPIRLKLAGQSRRPQLAADRERQAREILFGRGGATAGLRGGEDAFTLGNGRGPGQEGGDQS